MTAYIADASHQDYHASQLGGKALSLAMLEETGYKIPQWFVLTPDAFFDSINRDELDELVRQTQNGQLDAQLDARIDTWFSELELSSEVQNQLRQALKYHKLDDELLAVRSSARFEDGANTSFAGIYHSELAIAVDQLEDAIKRVWRAAFTQQVLTYSQVHQLPTDVLVPSIIIQKLVRAEISGILFSADPVKNRTDHQLIAATYGLSADVASGASNADLISIHTGSQSHREEVAHKPTALCVVNESIEEVPVAKSLVDLPVLSIPQIRYLSKVASQLETFFGTPQDIEWAIEKDTLYILQSRPITAFNKVSRCTFWVNDGLEEQWPGIILPATYQFLRKAYGIGYQAFFSYSGVSLEKNSHEPIAFDKLLGLIRGRLYWNHSHLGTMWQNLPLFSYCQQWVDSQLPQLPGRPAIPPPNLFLALLGSLNAWILFHRFEGELTKCNQDLALKLKRLPKQPQNLNAHQLVANIQQMFASLYAWWHIPILVTYTSKIWFNVLTLMCLRWVDAKQPGLANDLICHDPRRPSHHQTLTMNKLAQMMSTDESMTHACRTKTLKQAEKAMQKNAALFKLYQEYLSDYGQASDEGFVLEQPGIAEDPLPFIRSLGEWAHRLHNQEGKQEGSHARGLQTRLDAEDKVQYKLKGNPVKYALFQWALSHAKGALADKEQLHRHIARLMTQCRWFMLILAQQLKHEDQLQSANDIFYLDFEEVVGFVDGSGIDTDLKSLVKLRKREYNNYESSQQPSPAFETQGMVNVGNSFQWAWDPSDNEVRVAAAPGHGPQLQGQGCYPGKLRGTIKLVDPSNPSMPKPGEILLAKQGHPSLIHLFPAASGLIMEFGSPLSHVSILARELGLPTIVGVPHATQALNEGDLVEVDSEHGTVKVIQSKVR